MTFKIHFTVRFDNGSEHDDYILVSGDTVDDICNRATAHLAQRGGYDPWSEEIVSG